MSLFTLEYQQVRQKCFLRLWCIRCKLCTYLAPKLTLSPNRPKQDSIPNTPQSKKPFWMHLLVLQGEEAQVEAWFGLFRDSAKLDARQDARFACNVSYDQKSIQTHLMELIDDICHGISLRSVWRSCQFQCNIGAQFAPNALQSKKPFWRHLLVLQGEEAQVEAQFDQFRDSANLDPRQDAWFPWNVTYAQKSIQTHLMELLVDMCHMKSRFGLFGDSVSFDARQVYDLYLMHHRLRNHFGHTRWY